MTKRLTFKQYFFKIYDRKIREGEISFSRIGISKNVFNQLCNNRDFFPTQELIDILKTGLKLSDEEYYIMSTYIEGDE